MDHTQSQKLTTQPDEAAWRKSSLSGGNSGGDCVEVASLPDGGGWAVRDSKDPEGPMLSFTPGAWSAFLRSVKSGELG